MLPLLLCLCVAAAEKEGVPEKLIPDFSVKASGENTLAFSEALKDHEAMLINITREYGNCTPSVQPELQAYLLYVFDQNDMPVSGVMVAFCTDTSCILQQSDDNGTISFNGTPDIYHLQLLKVPEGYSFDSDFEVYTEKVYEEWLLRIRKE